jgi:hypothetical protein
MPSLPLALTDQQLAIVSAIARPISYRDRKRYLEAVADALAGLKEIGDGAVAQAAMQAQRQFFRPPLEAD